VCGRGPLNQTSKSNIFIFYSPPYPPLSFPSPSSSPHDATTPRRPTPSTLAPRASALARRQSREVAVSRPRRDLAGDLPRPLPATSPPPHTPRTAEVGPGRAPLSSTTRRDGGGHGGSRRRTARPGSGGWRGAGSASPLSSPLSLARARWIAVLQCTAKIQAGFQITSAVEQDWIRSVQVGFQVTSADSLLKIAQPSARNVHLLDL